MKRFIISTVFLWLATTGLQATESLPDLPQNSRLVEVNQHLIHLHEQGDSNEKPVLVLLSGPTDNWHSDSAWWVLAQNYLSQRFQIISIDRAGQGWSERIEAPSYRQFAEDLAVVLKEQKNMVIVAFASSNLAVNLLLQDPEAASRVQGVLLIDPDVLTPHSIEHYASETDGYKTGWAELEAYIRAGKYDERNSQKLAKEREHLEHIIPENYQELMDWDYYRAIEMIRQSRDYQIHKFLEASVYREDLLAAKRHAVPTNMPLVILDTDFESAYLEQLEDEDIKASIAQWRQEGIQWFFDLAQKSQCGAYWPVATQEHLLMMTQPELIEQAVEKLLACSD